ncbi:uncharacterized protein PHACADRAFT_257015 [Phanerochaete carnosa HHB-10118-sp]|uniref:Uncharacterized protein n=1 Tax=Phanerochaete carnosa (strain HHB-10118-sp) TaxID=650164 RepID=K5WZR4_PHACS|nr:uncharacterized protein PHACADRAFT_257015 [Phanerochaete carnosa HHB-10118-sp]EKM56007.1 hypothetical protein PHACADRAFT_257015 [Phanerochaete carnosa HHB-10118-sp]
MWLALTLTRYILGMQSPIDVLDKILDFGAVDEDLRESLAKLVADALTERHSSRVTQTPPWVIDAVIFLLSIQEVRPQIAGHDEGSKPPPPGVLALRDCFCGPATAIATGIRLRRSPFVPLAHKLLHVCENGIVLKHALALYTPYLCNKVNNSPDNRNENPTHAHRSLVDVLKSTTCETHLSEWERQRVFDDIRDLLGDTAKRIHLPSGAWPDVSVEVIVTLGQLALFASRSDTIKIFTSMWQDPDSFGLFWFFAGLHNRDRLDEESEAGQLCKEVLAQADAHGTP